MALGNTSLAVRKVSFDILNRNVRAGRNRNKNAMAPTGQGVLTAAELLLPMLMLLWLPLMLLWLPLMLLRLLLLILHGVV